MKNLAISILSFILIGLSACTNTQEQKLTKTDEETIKKELEGRVKQIIKATVTNNASLMGDVYWDNDDFISVRGSTVKNYDQYMEIEREWVKQYNSGKWEEGTYTFRILDKNTALVLYQGEGEVYMKEGPDVKLNNFTASMLFKRIKNKWKVIYTTEYGEYSEIVQDTTMTEK